MMYLAANIDRSAALSRTSIAATLLLCLSSLLAGCDTTPSKDSQTSEALTAVQENSTGSAEEFLIVDCLLPGQVRQLGGNFNYLTQRRPIKTSQSDCEIRGGEYVAYDRADYSTALKIWLPLAKAGDANAQTYVGEIYEKGLGLRADYALAAHWYGEAVKQGYSRAQINLGNLYEKGLGVAQDKERALNLYRSASGLGADHLLYASTLSTSYVPVQEYNSVQQELASEQQRSAQLSANLASVSSDLERESAALGTAEKELRASRSKLEAAVASGGDISASATTGSAQEQQLLASVLTMEAEQNDLASQLELLRQQNDELATSQQALVEQLSSNERTRNEQQARVQQLEQELAQARGRVSRSEQELASAAERLAQEQAPSAELARLQAELETSNQALNDERIKQARLSSEREALAEQLAATEAQVSGYQSRIEQMGRQMALEQQRIEQSEAEIAALRSDLAQQGSSAAEQQPQIVALQRSVELKNESLAEQRRLYQLLADEKSAIEQQVAASGRLKSGYESQVADLKAELAASDSALQSSRAEAEALASRLAENEASNSALTPEVLALRRDLQEKSAALAEEKVRLAGLESQSQARQQQLNSSQSALEQTSQKLAAVEKQYTMEKASLEDLLDQRERELDDIQHQLLLSRANMQMERSASEEALAAQASSHEQALSAQRSELEQLTSQVASQYDLVQAQKAEIARLQQQASNYQDEIASGDVSPAGAPGPQVAALTADGPAIEIIEPPVVLTRSQATVHLRTFRGERQVIGKVSAPSGLLSLSVNGETPTITSNNLFRASVPLTEDPTPVEVVLVDNEGRRAAVSFSFIDQQENGGSGSSAPIIARTSFDNSGRFYDVPMGDYHALIIGNNQYRNFSTLATAVNDARETDKVLREKYGFKTKLLLNADRYTILAALNELRETLDADDNLLIYYAGHGKLDESSELGYWLPVDADQDNNINWISNKSITDILNVIEAKHILVVADSCYAGTLTQTPIARAQLDIPDDLREEWVKVMAETRARITLTSGGVEPVLDGGGGRHSVFAKAFLDALRDNSGVLEGYSLYSRVLEVMAAADSPLGQTQIPQYAPIHLAGHESGEFFFNPG